MFPNRMLKPNRSTIFGKLDLPTATTFYRLGDMVEDVDWSGTVVDRIHERESPPTRPGESCRCHYEKSLTDFGSNP